MRAKAWSPAHLSVLFRPVGEPGGYTGSVGAGICIDRGVTTTVGDSGEPGSRYEVVEEALSRLGAPGLSATHELDVPVGSGFGSSGALALSTSLAAAALTGRSFNDAARAAHRAELACSTGLGDVAAQTLGGAVIRTGPGVPPGASLDRIPAPPAAVGYLALGERRTSESLRPVEELPELDRVVDDPRLEGLLDEGLAFSRRTGLTTPRVEEVVEGAVSEGGSAAPAHLGETVVFVGARPEEAEEARIARTGAHVTEVVG